MLLVSVAGCHASAFAFLVPGFDLLALYLVEW